jgi:hypothetical protein
MDLNNDLTVDCRNNVRIVDAQPQLALKGTSANDECMIFFGTPDTGQTGKKSAIRAYVLNSSGMSQLGFLQSTRTANVSAVNSDVSMLIGRHRIGINMNFGAGPKEILDLREGILAFANTNYSNSYGCRWSAVGTSVNGIPERSCYSKITASQTNWGGSIGFYTRPHAYVNPSSEPTLRMHIGSSGFVGIGAVSSTWTLAVAGSFAATGTTRFEIPHPDPNKEWRLRHAVIECPSRGGLMYKLQKQCVKGSNESTLPSYLKYLAEDLMCFVSPFRHHGGGLGRGY